MKSLFIASLILGIWFISGTNGESFEHLVWEGISREIVEVNAVWVDSQNHRTILAGTDRGVFKTKDGGGSWQGVLLGVRVNFLSVDPTNKDLIYVACSSGLFFSRNQGKTWQRIYQGNSDQGANCLSLIKLKGKEVYLGTQTGLLNSQDNGRSWHRFSGNLGNLSIQSMAVDRINKLIYLVTPDGVYRIDRQGASSRVFVSRSADSQDTETDLVDSQVNYICIDSDKPQEIYLATDQGIFRSQDSGRTWMRFSDFGLLSKRVRFMTILPGSVLLAATKSGVFVYYQGRWQELSLRLTLQDIRFLAADDYGNIYAAGNKGLFRSGVGYRGIICESGGVRSEPSIQEIQQAAIKYAQVIDPKQIAAHQRLSRLKAILPDFSLDYDKTISAYNNSELVRFAVGPQDWGMSLKWNLSDLIWSEQHRLIDSQVRLMVKLRQDILDEVTRLYFERYRIKAELMSSPDLQPKMKQDKELRIEELTALLDGLTGGYFSKFNLTE